MLIVFARVKGIDCRLKAIYADLHLALLFLFSVDILLTPKDIRLSTVWAVAAKHLLRSVALENLDYDITTPGPLPTLR